MIERCSDISSVSSLRILIGMLFGPAIFLSLKFEIISIISTFVQGEMKKESWLGGGKYSNIVRTPPPPFIEGGEFNFFKIDGNGGSENFCKKSGG